MRFIRNSVKYEVQSFVCSTRYLSPKIVTGEEKATTTIQKNTPHWLESVNYYLINGRMRSVQN